MRRDLGTALVVAAALVASPRRADGANGMVVQLDYQADEHNGCVGEDELRRMVAGQLGRDPFRADADQRVAVTIAKTGPVFEGRIVWTEADGRPLGERRLSSRSRDCDEIAANVAFAIVVQLQLVERGGQSPGEAGGLDAGPPPPTSGEGSAEGNKEESGKEGAERNKTAPPTLERPDPPEPSPVGPGEVARERLRLHAGAGPALGLGMTPQATAFGRLFVAARFRRFSAEIAGDAALPTTQRESDGTGVALHAMGSSVAGCAHVSFASACLLGRLGWLRARGLDVAAPRTSWGRFSEVGMRLAVTRELGRLVLSLHADGLVMLSRWDVVLNDAVVWTVPRVGVLVGLDVGLRFF